MKKLRLCLLFAFSIVLGNFINASPPAGSLGEVKLTPEQWKNLRSSNIIILPVKGSSGLEIRTKKNPPKTIDDKIFQILEPISQHIVVLNLSNSQVSEAGLNNLHKFPNLKQVSLEKTGLSEAAIEILKKKFPNLEIIKE